jgi:predicted RNase H-like HicB family nuclease
MEEITFNVERDEDSTWLVASWDDPSGKGGITTQGQDLRELQDMVKDAVRCHFGDRQAPRRIRFHFLTDPVLTAA